MIFILERISEKPSSYVGEEEQIGNKRKGRLNPLDNVKDSTIQYVSGMAERSSLRISLNHNKR